MDLKQETLCNAALGGQLITSQICTEQVVINRL